MTTTAKKLRLGTILQGKPRDLEDVAAVFGRTERAFRDIEDSIGVLQQVPEWVFNVRYFGAVGNNVNDDTDAVKSAIAAAQTYGKGKVYFPAGIYLITERLDITQGSIEIYGDGPFVTLINFVPATYQSLFRFWTGVASPGTIEFYAAICHLGVMGTNAVTKIGIEVIDTSNFLCEDVYIDALTGTDGANGPSVGMVYKGREQAMLRGVKLFADRPLQFSANPNFSRASLEDTDHFHATDLYLGAQSSTEYNVTVDDDVNISNMTFDGHLPWVLGAGGFHWNRNATGPAPASFNLRICGLRYEQAQDANGYSIYIDGPANRIQCVEIENCHLAIDCKGIFLRDAENVSLINNLYPSASKEALNVDSTVLTTQMLNNYWQSGSTASLGTCIILWGTNIRSSTAPLPATGLIIGGTTYADGFQVNGTRHFSYTFTLVDGAAPTNLPFFNVYFATKVVYGRIAAVSADGPPATVVEGGQVIVDAGGNPTIIVGTANFVITNTAGKLCWLGNNPPQVRNRTGKDVTAVIDLTYAF